MAGNERIFTTTCNTHCGGACVLKVHVKEGKVTRIETDNGPEPQYRACLKGRAWRQRVYAPDRVLSPMKRVGERGEGKFAPISWDEALNTVAGELERVRRTYGPGAVLFVQSAGDICSLNSHPIVDRLMTMTGGYSHDWAINSFEGGLFAELASYGTINTRNTIDDLPNSRLILMWGWNPAVSIHECNSAWFVAQAREKGCRVVSIDPRCSDSTAALADQWIPLRPGTDAALLVAMAHVMVNEGLQDQKFLDNYTVGFEQFKDYLAGREDGMPKTPGWAESVTGVPVATIAKLAREFATIKPAALIAGIGPGRTAYGEQYHRAAIVLAAMTGNIGIHGGNAAGRSWTGLGGYPFFQFRRRWRVKSNPIDDATPRPKVVLPGREAFGKGIGQFVNSRTADAMIEGKAGGYPDDYKMLILVNINYIVTHLNTNKCIRGMKKMEFIVVLEHFMTPTARYADLILPTCTFLERNDMTCGNGLPFLGYTRQAIKPVGKAKSHVKIISELAPRLQVKEFGYKEEEDWVKEAAATSGVTDYTDFKEKGIYRFPLNGPYAAFQEQIEDLAHHPFPTPSGKIEIYSQRIAELANPLIPPVPQYIETWESRNDPLAHKYPLQLITTHLRRRSHTQFDNIPWLKELEKQSVIINTADAEARGIKDGDMARVFNDRGAMIIPARVTERIMPGVVDVPEGAWYRPDKDGIDRGGCANVLTRDEPSPIGSFPTNTSLVQVEKA